MGRISTRGIDWSEVGTRIKRLRRDRRLTQTELVEGLTSASFLSLIESGLRRPSEEVLEQIAERLNVSVQEILTGRSPDTEVRIALGLEDARQAIHRGELDRAGSTLAELTPLIDEFGIPRLAARARELSGAIAERRNKTEEALSAYERAEEAWQSEATHLKHRTVTGLARCHRILGNVRLSIHLLESYLLELERDGVVDPAAAMAANSGLVRAYSAAGLHERAAISGDKAISLVARVDDPEELACMHMSVARSLFEQGRMADSLDAIRRAEDEYLSLGWEIDAARARLNRGIVQLEKGDLDDARANLAGSAETLRSSNHPAEGARALNELGRLERIAGRTDVAETHLREARELLDQDDVLELALNARELGLCLVETNRAEAESLLRRAIDLYMTAGDHKATALAYKHLGDLHARHGAVAESAQAYRAGLEAIEAN